MLIGWVYMELVKKINYFLLANKGKVFIIMGIMLVLSFVIIPFIRIKIGLGNLAINDIDKIVYAKYEGQPLSTKIKELKETDSGAKEEIVLFSDIFDKASIKLYPNKHVTTSEMVFIYLKDGRVENAYVVDEMLGFKYGEYWVEAKGFNSFLRTMNIKDPIEIKELSSDIGLNQRFYIISQSIAMIR